MRVLAIETATPRGSVAVVGRSGIEVERSWQAPGQHLEALIPAIEAMLRDAGLTRDAVEGLAVSLGPGGFTGLRIGLMTASTWAVTAGIPLVGVSTLEVVAEGSALGAPTSTAPQGLVLAAIDVRRGEIAAALFRYDDPVTRLTADAVLSPGDLGEALPEITASDRLVVAGDALERYREAILAALPPHAVPLPASHGWPRASVGGSLGRARLMRGDRDDPLHLTPHYARAPVAKRPSQ